MNEKALIAFNETIGWCPPEKARYLYEIVSEHKPEIVLEIGIYAGKSLFPMAVAAEAYGGRVIGIEPFSVLPTQEGINPKENDDWWRSVNYNDLEHTFMTSVAKWELEPTIQLLKKTSKAALADMPSEIGVIHQDSNHSEEVSFWETEHYAPLLKKGGFYILDDIDWNIDGKLTNEKSIALLDSMFTRVKWQNKGESQWGAWQYV